MSEQKNKENNLKVEPLRLFGTGKNWNTNQMVWFWSCIWMLILFLAGVTATSFFARIWICGCFVLIYLMNIWFTLKFELPITEEIGYLKGKLAEAKYWQKILEEVRKKRRLRGKEK